MTTTSETSQHTFGSYKIEVDASDKSAGAYGGRPWQEEFVSPFYMAIKDCLEPEVLLDIGANYGVTSLFMKHVMPDTPLIAVEANTDLIPFIENNLQANNKGHFSVINAIAGEKSSKNASFSINKRGSQDSRVLGEGAHWSKIDVPVTTIDSLLRDYRPNIPFFAKIDTQGYERFVFAGGMKRLETSSRWLIKTEFAPDWLISQGTDPVEFLTNLIKRFNVVEFPARYSFHLDLVKKLFEDRLVSSNAVEFVDYAKSLNRKDKGWVDLLIAPKNLKLITPMPMQPDDSTLTSMNERLEKVEANLPAAFDSTLSSMNERLEKVEANLPAAFAGLSILRQIDVFLDADKDLTPQRMNRNNEHGHAILLGVMARQAALSKGSLDGKSVIEIGCTREVVFPQCSTQKLAFFASIFGMEFTTVDMNPESIEAVNVTLSAYSIRSKAVVSKGEDFLAKYDKPIDFLYLDAFDLAHGNHSEKRIEDYEQFLNTKITDSGCRTMHLECAEALLQPLSNGETRMPVGGVVVFDDTKLVQEKFWGKGELAVPYLLENGFKLITRGRATVALERTR